MISGLRIVSVYDPATGIVVQMNKIAPDGDFKKEALFVESSKGSQVYSGDDSSFEFTSFDISGFNQLDMWMKNQTPVRLVTFGVEDHILWYEDSLITVREKVDFKTGNLNSITIKIAKKGGVHNIKVGANLLWLLAGWSDENNDGLCDNYTLSGENGKTLTSTFTSGNQVIKSTDSASMNFESMLIVYPIQGAQIKFSLLINESTDPDLVMNIKSFGFGNAELKSVICLVSDNELVMLTPSNQYTMKIGINAQTSFGGELLKFGNPYLGVPRTYTDVRS